MNLTLHNPVLDQFRDIHDLDPVFWWPLAPGWWVLLVAVAMIMVGGLLIAWWIHIWNRDWRSDARHRLRELGTRVHQLGAKEITAQLAELLRRIAMARCGRPACASLTGESWLHWLSSNDPAGFPWSERGRILIDLPYAPPRDQIRFAGADPDSLRMLIEAVLPWLEKEQQKKHCVARRMLMSVFAILRIRSMVPSRAEEGDSNYHV
ncbi:hypothetical protein CCP3SC5AM1_70024 [Gammaproteobacteria bacterium]